MIRVLIERSLVKDKEFDYHQKVRQLKQKASHMKGYISGEMLIDPENESRCLVLSSWQNIESWKAWSKSEQRKLAKEQIRELLTEDEKVSVYESAKIK